MILEQVELVHQGAARVDRQPPEGVRDLVHVGHLEFHRGLRRHRGQPVLPAQDALVRRNVHVLGDHRRPLRYELPLRPVEFDEEIGAGLQQAMDLLRMRVQRRHELGVVEHHRGDVHRAAGVVHLQRHLAFGLVHHVPDYLQGLRNAAVLERRTQVERLDLVGPVNDRSGVVVLPVVGRPEGRRHHPPARRQPAERLDHRHAVVPAPDAVPHGLQAAPQELRADAGRFRVAVYRLTGVAPDERVVGQRAAEFSLPEATHVRLRLGVP